LVDELKDFMGKMGTGSRSSEDLTYGEAREAMGFILDETVNPVSFGAFAVAERWKSQTPEELAGFLDEIRSRTLDEVPSEEREILDVVGRFDGKVDSVNTEFAGSILATVAGVDIVTHAERNVPTQEGTTFLDLVDALGWDVTPSREDIETALAEVGFAYTGQSSYAPGLEALKSLRRGLGVRCFLNTIESMVNPFQAKFHVGSFYHLAFARRVCETFERCETQGPERILMIQGIEGQTELRSGDCLMAEWRGGELIEHDIHTEDLGLDYSREDLEAIGAEAGRGAKLLRQLFTGETVPDSYRESVAINAACRVFAGGEGESLEGSLDKVRAILGTPEMSETWEQLEAIFQDERRVSNTV
jgi:anthranilate phosphoribosyltransferase